MKVLLVNGSPKANGCTHAALEVVAGELAKCGIDTLIPQHFDLTLFISS